MSRDYILIVEDNDILAENFCRILKMFRTLKVSSAEEAIFAIDKSLPKLIFLDILLNGHSAFALLNELQSYSDTIKIPVVICSDLASGLDGLDLENYGVVEILDKSRMKPIDFLHLAERFYEAD